MPAPRSAVTTDLVGVLTAAAIAYGLLLVAMYTFQAQFVYFPASTVDATPADAGLVFEEVSLRTEDGVPLHGWWLPAARPARQTLLFLHGNAGNIAHRLDSLRIFHELGVDTLIIDYRGYGKSGGTPSESGTYADASAAWHYLTRVRAVPAGRIVVFGRSLGAAVAVWLATHRTVGALIIESGFTSLPDLAAHHYSWLPVRRLARYSYDSAARLPRVSVPILVVHSRDDEIIPFEHGHHLFAVAPEPKQFLILDGDHNAGFLTSRTRYVAGLRRFLDGLDQPAT